MNQTLKRAVCAALGVVALSGISTQASAITPLALDGAAAASVIQGAQSWNGSNDGYLGWAHNSDWFSLLVPFSGNVSVTMTGGASNIQPAFTVWNSGNAEAVAPASDHYNQIGNTDWLSASFVGFANNSTDAHFGNGPSNVGLGGLAAAGGAVASVGTNGSGNQFATLTFNNATPNTWYVLAAGGSGGG
ncbi:MAG: hypothetical protein ACKN9T_01685, partial [Candidatus Methylumidiphilus sp.]